MSTLSESLYNDILLQSAQQSRAWDKVRLGRFTGSGIGKLFTEPKTKADKEAGKLSQTAITYIEEKAMEFVTGEPIGEFSSRATDWGNQWEEHALRKLQATIGSPDEATELKPRFCEYFDYSGASPDAYMLYGGMKVGVELKCPFNPVYHMRHSRVLNAQMLKDHDADYYWQIQANIYFHKMPLWLFASFDPRQPDHRILHYCEILAVPEDIELMLIRLEQAEAMKQELIQYWLNK